MKMTFRPTALAALMLFAGIAAAATSASAQEVRRSYIVQLQDQPAASYTGGIAGLAATQPAAGAAFDFRASNIQAYVSYLGDRKNDVLATIPGATVLASYDVVLNGFAALLTDDEVLALKSNPAVADVQVDQPRHLDTVSTSTFLGLTAAGGLWSQFAGGALVKGENMVVGIVDGGIWPENPSFADRVDSKGAPTFDPAGTQAYSAAPSSFTGSCAAGEGFDPAKHCNNKLVGAKFYNAGFLAANLPKNWSEYYSPRDSNIGTDGTSTGHGGHGDHTASTAAGNSGVPVVIAGVPMGIASGMAPRARIAAYKICWTWDDAAAADGTKASNGCYSSDAVKAIDDAVKDGVNVINYSISGSTGSVADAVEQAFYRAALANVFVAASAGNSGPANAVAHISPWLTTVAASTHDRDFRADVKLGNNVTYSGSSVNITAVPPAPLVRAEDAGVGGADASLCFSSNPEAGNAGQVLLDPAKVAGKVVICTRGVNARVDKSLAVLNAGGIGMVMMDNGSGLIAETHSVPTVHVTTADGAAIKNYAVAQASAATAAISVFTTRTKPAPIMAGFSSRGPNMADPNILKPDLTAPGVDVIAAVTPPLTAAQHAAVVAGTLVPPGSFDTYSGTSMSSPHVAGLALLLKQAHPTWSPAAIKSALMTTGYMTLDDGLAGASNGMLPWSQGAGHVDPNKATDPGLVYDAVKADYLSYQCKVNKAAVTPASDCTTATTLDETYNLNLPSITVGTLQGSIPITVRRKVTNVGSSAASYTATASVPGITTVVTPPTLNLAPGETGSFTVTLTANSAPLNVWQFGSLTWNDGKHVVRSPIQARAGKIITSPVQLTSDKVSGSKLFAVTPGFSGRMTAIKGGLKEATLGDPVTLVPGAMTPDELLAACVAGADKPNMKVYNVTLPAGGVALRYALRQIDTSSDSDDHDLGLLAPDGTFYYSGNEGSVEAVQVASPAPGAYRVCVVAYASANPTMTHKLSSWVVGPSDVGGKLVVAVPGKVVAGNNATIGISWSGLDLNKRYLGGMQFQDLTGTVQATTLVRVETGNAGVSASDTARAMSNSKQ